jgi:Flp pilus assembly protein TadB
VSRNSKIAIAGVVVALILFALPIPLWVPVVLLLAAVALPVGAYLMLDPSQRRRLRQIQQRRREIR